MGRAGSDNAWRDRNLRKAIERSRLADVRLYAAGWHVPLDLALDILWLILRDEPEHYDRAAAKWIGRLAVERHVGLEQIDQALDALQPGELRKDVLIGLARQRAVRARPEPRTPSRLERQRGF